MEELGRLAVGRVMGQKREEKDSSGRRAWILDALHRHEGSLIRYARRFLGDLEQARDVVQDTFLALCRARQADVENHLSAWLFTVCRNRALDIRRKEGRMRPLSENAPSPVLEPTPSLELEAQEFLARVLRAVEDLPAPQREVIRLKFQEGLRYREISEVTGLSVSNVGFLIHTALKTLRHRLVPSGRGVEER